jgi:phospholipid transport system substrate-binding protein
MLEMVQHTIETSVEKASDGLLRPSLLHECESAVKAVVSTAFARFVKGFALALAVIAGISAAPRPVAAGQTPAEFISVIGADVLQEMRADVPLAHKEDYFRQMLRQDADLDGISRFVLGPYWRIASAEQRQEFEKLFEDYLIRSDGPLLVQHSGGTFRVTGSRTNPAGVIVTSQITSTQGQPIEMDWQLGISDGRYKIQDVSIDGVSAAISRRSQMEAMMSRAGGQVTALLAMMRQEG